MNLQRRTPMKRTALNPGTKGLARTGIKRKTEMKRVSIEPGKSGVNPVKAKPLKPGKPLTTKKKYDSTEEPCKVAVKKRSGGLCEICGIRKGQSVHHRRKQSQGGPWTLSNCMHLCGTGRGPDGCHGWITNTRTEYYNWGWLVYSKEKWADKKVLYRGEWAVLDDVGAFTPSLPFEEAA